MRKDYWAKLEPNVCYHIYNRANGRDNLFLKPRHYEFFLSRWEKYLAPYFYLHAYCLMPNHFHLLAAAKPLDDQVLEYIKENPSKKAAAFIRGEIGIDIFYTDRFKSFFTSYSGAFNKEQERHGSLFQQKFKRIVIRNRYHFLEKFHYIHHNPIHHRFCKNYEDWPYSSYHAYAYSGDHRLLSKMTVMDLFNQDIQELRTSHRVYQENFHIGQPEEGW